MDDMIFVGLFIVVVGLAFAYVRLCARIVDDVEPPVAPGRD